jgi:protein-S-isoprenylcysteine O-methyltransferase Ste14
MAFVDISAHINILRRKRRGIQPAEIQIHIGKGTPVPLAPTQSLIITGPYKLCRNPIHFGTIIYYLGVGTLVGSLTVGIMNFLLGLILFSFYNKFVEEKELLLRFGKEYEAYKRNTPFLIPKLWR